MRYKVLNESGTLTYCPFCNFINDDSSEMIDHMNTSHKGQYQLYVVKSLESDNNVLHLAKKVE